MIVVVPVDPPRSGLALSGLVEETPLSEEDAALLYEAATADAVRAVADSGGDLLVNYRDAETLPDGHAGDDPEAEVRAVVADALGGTADVRFERQVGSSRAARVGNAVSHLLTEEDVRSVGVLEPTAALVGRTDVDGAAMSLRRNEIVLGPAPEGRTYFAGFSEPIDFADAYAAPELATLARRADDAGLAVGFAPMRPTVATTDDLISTVAEVTARRVAGSPGADVTANAIERLGIEVVETDDGPAIGRR